MSKEALFFRLCVILSVCPLMGASFSTPNFIVEAPTVEIAKQVGQAAEYYRKELAKEWLSIELPRWSSPCPISVKVGNLGAGGATSFSFNNGEVYGWNMQIQGTLERILDSVLPHEISHTIFACYFRRPLPRWADEGAATLVEHESEKRRQLILAKQVLKNNKWIPLKTLLSMKEYPREMQNVLTLYAQGYTLANYLVQQGGKKRYLKFLFDAHKIGWERAIPKHYAFKNIDNLENQWGTWVLAGSPSLRKPAIELVAKTNTSKIRKNNDGLIVRSQSPEKTGPKKKFRGIKNLRASRSELHAPPPQKLAANQGAQNKNWNAAAKVSSASAGRKVFAPTVVRPLRTFGAGTPTIRPRTLQLPLLRASLKTEI